MMRRIVQNVGLAILLFWTASRAVAQSGDGVPEAIRYYETVAMMSSAVAADEATGTTGSNTMQLNFSVLGRDFDLKLEAHDPYAPGAVVRWVDNSGVVDEPATRDIFFRGRVEGDPDSWVRLTVRGDALAGVVATSEEVYFLEPAARFLGPAAASDTLAFRMSDVDTSSLDIACGTRAVPSFRRAGKGPHFGLREMLGEGTATVAAASLKRAVIGLIADYEYFSKASHGATSAADLAEILNSVDGIYQSELGVTLQVGPTVVFTTSSDPFTATTMLNLLGQVGTYKDANDNSSGQALYGSDLAHLFTGRNLDGSTIGIAYIGSLCQSKNGVGVDEDFSTSLTMMTLLLAHEMGHNFGAPHDNEVGSDCASEPGTYIMNPSLSSSLQQKFSPCSKSEIAPVVNNASCLDVVTAGSPTPTSPAPPPTPTSPAPPPATSTRTRTATRTPTATPTPAPPALNAVFVSQSVPTMMNAGQLQFVSITMRNTGTTPWTAANLYRLGAINPYDNTTWGFNRVALAPGASIAPGQQTTFSFGLTPPATAGTYNFQWRMVRDGVAWFGSSSTNVAVTVTGGGTPNAAYVSKSVPTTMTAGQQYSVSITMQNTGSTNWTAGLLYRLGAINPYDNFTWGMNRVALAGGDNIGPNQQKTFTWTVRAPSTPGTYNFQWRMVQDGVAWFGADSANTVVSVQ